MFDTLAEPNVPAASTAETGGAFHPDAFFVKPWRGNGVICDAFGIARGRYQQWGHSRIDEDGGLILEQTSTFESGLVNVFEWKILSSADGKIRARDLKTGKEARGERTTNGFLWRYKSMALTPFGRRKCQFSVLYSQNGLHEASNSTTISFLGVTVKTASAHFHHVS